MNANALEIFTPRGIKESRNGNLAQGSISWGPLEISRSGLILHSPRNEERGTHPAIPSWHFQMTKFAITEENASEEFGLIVDNVLGPSYLALLTK